MSAVKYYAIIVAGGSGSRMRSDIPKQFLTVNDKPVLMHTIEAFQASDFAPAIIVVLHPDFHPFWKKLCIEHNFYVEHQLVEGGDQRFHSVKKGLELIKGRGIIAIHDAVRPCVPLQVIDTAYSQANKHGNAVVAVKCRDSVRQKVNEGSISLNREEIYLVQTPQVFSSEILEKAYRQEYKIEFTDDASVVEMSGITINLIEGDPRNIKLTFPEDIRIAEYYLAAKK